MSRSLRSQDYIYVGIQLLLFALYAVDAVPITYRTPVSPWLDYFGIGLTTLGLIVAVLALLQLNRFLSPFPTPKEGSSLIQHGVFRWVRHPIYTGLLLMGIGWGVHTESFSRLGITLVLAVLFYFKSSYEEKRLQATFPDYGTYKQKAGRFFPKLSRKPPRN